VVPQRKDPYFNPPYSQCHSQDGFFVRLTLAQTLPLGGCDGGAIRATQFVPVAYSSEQLNCQEVDPNDGNYAASVTDLSLSPPPEAADLAINFGRHYNSQDPTAGALGVGWRYSYEWNLEEVDGVVTITTPTGRKDVYPFKEIGFDLAATNKYGDGSLVKDISGAFKLTTLDKTVYKFVFGKLVSINDRNNNQLNFTYTGGLLSQIDLCLAVPCGTPVQTLVVQNDGNGHLAGLSVGGVYSRTVTYSYTNGLLTDVKDVRDHHTTFSYYIGAPHQNLLQSATDPKGHRLIYLNYDNANRVSSALASFTTATGTDHPTAFDYSQAGQTTVTDARGNPAIYYYKGGNKPTNPLRTTQVLDAEGYQHTFNYDDAFHIKSQTDGNGQTTFYTYNSQGVLETISHTVTVNGVVQTYTTTTHYNSQNQATDVTDSRGFVTRITYDSGGNNIKTVTDPVSNTVTYDYYSGGRVKSVTTASNGTNKLVVNYLYDSAGFPQHVTRAFSTLVPPATTPSPVTIQVDYTYNAPDGRLLTQTDAYYTAAGAAPAVTYDYDKAGHIISFNNQKSQLSTWHYDDAGNLDTIVNYLGQQTTSTYNEINLPLDVSQQLVSTTLTTHYDYDDNANLKQITDPKLVATQYGYDKLNRQTSASLSVSAGTAQTLTQYDGVGNVIRITRANLGVNGGNQVTTYGYDELNRLITTTLGVGVFDYQVINSYDPASNLIGVKRTGVGNGADTNQITLATASYDALNRPLASTVYPGVTSPLTTTYSYNDPANAYTVTNPDGIVTTYQADNNDRLIQMTTTPFAGAVITASPQTAYLAYNATGQVIHAVDPSGNWTDTTYDELHRVKTNTQYPQPLGQGTPLTTQIIYTDQTQPKITVSGPAHTGGNLTQVLQYDSVGRLLSMNDGVLNTAYQYDQQGNLFKEIDPLKTTTYTYENTGWLKTVSQQVTGPSGLQTLTTAYNYDLVGNRISTTDANSHSISATYDVLNRLVGTQDALSNTTSRVYDGLSRLLSYQDGKRQTTNFTYDNISRLVQIASVGNLLTTFNYSGNQLASMQDKLGTNPATTTTYTYDGLDRLGAVSSLQGVVQYGYDSSNRRTALKFGPDTAHLQTVGYQYDAYDRLTAITGWQGQLSYGYDGERLSTLTYPNGVNASFSYDVANRLTDLSYKNGPATIYSAHYDLDPLSQPVTLTESLNGTSRLSTYSYDELSRLRVETTQLGRAAVLTSTYTYDKVGNRTQLVAGQPNGTTVTSLYGYDAADRLITTTAKASNARVGSSTTYGYDANNSLTSEIFSGPGGSGGYRTQYSYDTRNRLTGWQQQQSGTSVVSNMAFGYDGNNTRISLANNGQLTSYLQDAAGGGGLPVVLQEATTGAAGPASYLYPVGSTSPIMQTDTGGNTSWYHLDNTGSVRFMTDGGSGSPGAIKTAYTYNAFGQTISQTATVSNTHTYAGEQLDPTGLYYDRARFYNPATGRFITQDTFDGSSMLPPTQNRYVYAGNTPTTFTDPSGHCFVICAIVGAVVGAVFSYGSQVINNLGQGKGWNSFTDINWGRVLIGAGAGAVAGATAGLASGAIGWAFGADAVSSWGAAAVSGAVGQVAYGQSERAITNVLAGRNVLDGLFQVDDILGDAALGAVFGVGFKAVASAWSSWRGRIGVGEGNEGGVSGPVTPDDNTPRQLTSGIRPRLEEPSRLIKPSDLEGLTVRQVNRKLKAIGATVDRANDGGPRWRWTEDGVQFEVRYHLHANPLFRTGPSGFGKTIKYGKVIVGNGSPITPEELTNFDILLQARLGPALDNQISSGFTGVPTDWLDPFGVIYFTADNVLGGRFSNATHILGEGNPWRPGMVGSERRVIYL
jgi:RHS repeat-associated protein